MKKQRIDQFLSHAGLGSRKEVRQLIRKGRVTIDGSVCRSHGDAVPAGAAVHCDGEPVEAPPGLVHAVLHKPLGYACSHDEREAPLIYDLLPAAWRRAGIESAGRLDRATSGLLILSTDGQLLHRLIQPKRHVPKRYRIRYTGELRRDAVRRCAEGLKLPDDERPCRPAELTLADEPGCATLVLHEGRHHQVRRMIRALGGTVVMLHRDRFGGLDLPADLDPGAVRELRPDEMQALLTQPDSDADAEQQPE